LYMSDDLRYDPQISKLKIREIRQQTYNAYMTDIFSQADLDSFLKDEIEGKGIVVIDEIDKLVRSSDTTSSSKASDEGV